MKMVRQRRGWIRGMVEGGEVVGVGVGVEVEVGAEGIGGRRRGGGEVLGEFVRGRRGGRGGRRRIHVLLNEKV